MGPDYGGPLLPAPPRCGHSLGLFDARGVVSALDLLCPKAHLVACLERRELGGALEIGQVTTNGGFADVSEVGAAGGHAGDVTVTGGSAGVTVGYIRAIGGSAAAPVASPVSGGIGAAGGAVSVAASGGALTVLGVDTSGGFGDNGGTGAAGGNVTLSGANVLVGYEDATLGSVGGNIFTVGGSVYSTVMPGSAGPSGHISVTATAPDGRVIAGNLYAQGNEGTTAGDGGNVTVSAGTGGITIGYIKTQGGYASYGSGRGGMAGSVEWLGWAEGRAMPCCHARHCRQARRIP